MTLIYVFATLLLLLILATFVFRIKLYRAKKNGKYPPKGQLKQDDVLRLVSDGETILAMRAYRKLHRCGLKEAKAAIEQIKKGDSFLTGKHGRR